MALYTYESPEVGDLTFVEGDVVLVLEKEGEWWRGCVGDQTGLFPSNYVRPVELPEVSQAELMWKKNCQIKLLLYFCFTFHLLTLGIKTWRSNQETWWEWTHRRTLSRCLMTHSVILLTFKWSKFTVGFFWLVNRGCAGSHHHWGLNDASASPVSGATDRGAGQELHRLVARGTASKLY